MIPGTFLYNDFGQRYYGFFPLIIPILHYKEKIKEKRTWFIHCYQKFGIQIEGAAIPHCITATTPDVLVYPIAVMHRKPVYKDNAFLCLLIFNISN